jgi:hypothetical protein
MPAIAQRTFARSILTSILNSDLFIWIAPSKRYGAHHTVSGMALFMLALLPVSGCCSCQHPEVRRHIPRVSDQVYRSCLRVLDRLLILVAIQPGSTIPTVDVLSVHTASFSITSGRTEVPLPRRKLIGCGFL